MTMGAKMAPDKTARGARVILGVTCFADADASLEIAVLLAKVIGLDIQGVLVTDEAAVVSANIPGAQVIDYGGGGVRNVTSKTMIEAYETDARMFRKRLTSAAEQASIKSDFQVAHGKLAQALLHWAEAGDLVVYGFRRPIHRGDAVILIMGDQTTDESLLPMARRLAVALGERLVVLLAGKQKNGPQIQKPIDGLEIRYFDGASLIENLNRMSPSTVIADPELLSNVPIERLVDIARCPVIVPLPSNRAKAVPNESEKTRARS